MYQRRRVHIGGLFVAQSSGLEKLRGADYREFWIGVQQTGLPVHCVFRTQDESGDV